MNEVIIWGTGKAKREFLYVDDMALASIFIMNINKELLNDLTDPMQQHINVGFGKDISIKELADLIRDIVGYNGSIFFDESKPDGPPQKLLDSSLINKLGWFPRISLEDGLNITFKEMFRSYRK